GLSVDTAGALWVVQSSGGGTGATQLVEKRTIAGVPAGVSFGSYGSADGQFSLPFHAVFYAPTNLVFVADFKKRRVQGFDLAVAPVDTTPPTITSFTASGTTTATFNLTFSEAVTGVTNTSFTATGSSGVTVTAIGAPTGSGTTWSVPVSYTGAAGGTVTL